MIEAVVRPATVQDAPGIARVHVDAWRETYQGILRLFEEGAKALVEEGFRSMVLWVLEENRTRGFYEHLGGSVVAQKMLSDKSLA